MVEIFLCVAMSVDFDIRCLNSSIPCKEAIEIHLYKSIESNKPMW